MKTNKKILLSTVAILTLLLSGCTDEQTAAHDAAKSANIAGGTDNNTAGGTDNNSGTSDHNPSSDNDNSGDTGTPGNGDNNSDDTIPGPGNGDNNSDDIIPGPGNGADIPITTKTEGGWYGRTVVSATASDGKVYQHSSAGVFGELIDSTEAKDQHDIPSYGSAILQVVFPQDSEDYFSNYQSFDANGNEKRSWVFQIKNQQIPDLSNAPIKISLKGIKKVTYKKVDGKIIYDHNEKEDKSKASQLTLIDVDNATSYTVEQLATANLTMEGKHTRTFKWVLGTVENDDYYAAEAVDNAADITTSSFKNDGSITSDEFDTASIKTSKPGGKFGLPPQ